MTPQEATIINMQGEAAIEAHEALQGSVECLPHLLELAGECSMNEIMLMLGFMGVYQMSLEGQRICQCLNDIRETLEGNSNNEDNNSRRVIEHLEDIAESIDCAGAKSPDFWMTSPVAAVEKANEIGLAIPPDWSLDDLRYKLHQAIYGGDNG
jgi:hypothetical protein